MRRGELFQAVIRGKSEEELAELVRFYDYLEIQPIGNNMFMLESDRYEAKTVEDLQNYNRKIVELGERYHKPVVATCDVHFLNPEDEQYRRILRQERDFQMRIIRHRCILERRRKCLRSLPISEKQRQRKLLSPTQIRLLI